MDTNLDNNPQVLEVEPQEIKLKAGEVLFNEGDDSNYAYLIVEGSVELTKEANGTTVHIVDISGGNIFGEMGVFDGATRSATSKTKTDVVLKCYDRDALVSKIHKDPSFAMPIMNQLITNLRQTSDKLAHNQFKAIKEAVEDTDVVLEPQKFWTRIKVFFDADADINEFQPDAVEIERSRLPGSAIATLYAIAIMLVGLVLWASLSYMDTRVMATGLVITTRPNIILQPIETAKIKTITAKVGDTVSKGQILATLDPTFAEADVNASKAALRGLMAQQARLEAELYSKPVERFSSDEKIHVLEKEVYERRMKEFESKLSSKAQQVNQIEAQIRTNIRDAEDMAGQVTVLKEIEAMRSKLMDDGYGSRVNYLSAKNQRLSLDREQRKLHTSTERMRHQLVGLKADEDAFVSEWRSKTASELVKVRRSIDELNERLKKMLRKNELVEIKAPADGIVLEVAKLSVGSVIQTAEKLFTIVPTNVPMEVEADINPKDVGQIQVGDKVRVKLDSLPFQKHGMLHGVVRLIGNDTIDKNENGKQSTVYRARIEIVKEDLRNVPPSFHLMAGMKTSNEITVGKRKVITYFIYPVMRTISTSLREP